MYDGMPPWTPEQCAAAEALFAQVRGVIDREWQGGDRTPTPQESARVADAIHALELTWPAEQQLLFRRWLAEASWPRTLLERLLAILEEDVSLPEKQAQARAVLAQAENLLEAGGLCRAAYDQILDLVDEMHELRDTGAPA